jgi:hypothetical protein
MHLFRSDDLIRSAERVALFALRPISASEVVADDGTSRVADPLMTAWSACPAWQPWGLGRALYHSLSSSYGATPTRTLRPSSQLHPHSNLLRFVVCSRIRVAGLHVSLIIAPRRNLRLTGCRPSLPKLFAPNRPTIFEFTLPKLGDRLQPARGRPSRCCSWGQTPSSRPAKRV